MKKHDLIDLLLKIDGNPEIVLWNGFVGDVQQINPEIQDDYLVKQSFEARMNGLIVEKARDLGTWPVSLTKEEYTQAKSRHNFEPYEYNQWVSLDDIKRGYYKKKRVLILQAKPSGKEYHDRLGKVRY
jgi:hypothetical protein